MKTIYVGAAALAALVTLNAGAFAQGTTTPAPATTPAATAAPAAAVTLPAADQTKFTAWVASEKKAAATVPTGFVVKVGEAVPASVTLYEIPATAGVASITKYRYVAIGGKTVLVDPASRKIVYIVG